jgi:hypothetical protein
VSESVAKARVESLPRREYSQAGDTMDQETRDGLCDSVARLGT